MWSISGQNALLTYLGREYPLRVLSDRGSVFLGRVMEKVCDLLGVDRVLISPYRPQSNGVVEHLHGTLNPMLAKWS